MKVYLLLWLDVAMANKEVIFAKPFVHHISCSPHAKDQLTISMTREVVTELVHVDAESYAKGRLMLIELLAQTPESSAWMYPFLSDDMQEELSKRVSSRRLAHG